jgi:hypothetical protein
MKELLIYDVEECKVISPVEEKRFQIRTDDIDISSFEEAYSIKNVKYGIPLHYIRRFY